MWKVYNCVSVVASNQTFSQGNILVDEHGNALLCDFGLSRVRHESTRTLTGVQSGGKLRYLAPELSSGEGNFRTTEASDMFALAMCFLELGTLETPFKEYANELRAMVELQKGNRPSRVESLGGLPALQTRILWTAMNDMWATSPKERPLAWLISDFLATEPEKWSTDSLAWTPTPTFLPPAAPPLRPRPRRSVSWSPAPAAPET